MNDKPLLSICIPTYNRALYLKNLLDSITAQFSDIAVKNQIEVIVSDNDSTDNTKKIVLKFIERYNNIKYFKHNNNVGMINNFVSLWSRVNGEYFWTIGDDDILTEESLSILLAYLQKRKYAAILLNFSKGENNNPYILISSNALEIKKDKIYNNHRLFFAGEDYKNFFGINFISGLIFQSNIYRKFKKKIQKLHNCYLHSYVFLFIATEGPILRIAQPLVICRASESGRRYDHDTVQNEKEISKSYNDYILFSKELGYIFEKPKFDKIHLKSELKGKIYYFFKKIYLIKFLRFFYRLPRLFKYYRSFKKWS